MNDTFITMIAIGAAAVLMFIFPMMTLADRNDDITQLTVQAETNDLKDEICRTGKLTQDRYNAFISSVHATGNTYDVEIQFKILDENPSKKTAQGTATVIGENVYYSVYTTQIVEKLNDASSNNEYLLKEGDMVSINVKNTSATLAQTLRGFYYKVTGNNTYSILGSSSGTITVNGK